MIIDKHTKNLPNKLPNGTMKSAILISLNNSKTRDIAENQLNHDTPTKRSSKDQDFRMIPNIREEKGAKRARNIEYALASRSSSSSSVNESDGNYHSTRKLTRRKKRRESITKAFSWLAWITCCPLMCCLVQCIFERPQTDEDFEEDPFYPCYYKVS